LRSFAIVFDPDGGWRTREIEALPGSDTPNLCDAVVLALDRA